MSVACYNEEIEPLLENEVVHTNNRDSVSIAINEDSSDVAVPSCPDHHNTGRQPCVPLEPGKTFHVFLAHSNEDKTYVDDLLDCLENEPYNFRCCYSPRDFIPGEPVIDMMEKYIALSQNVLMLMSPSFFESEFCQEEKRMAEYLQAAGQNRVIPILIKPYPLRLTMKSINYIDATAESEEEVLRKIVEAIKHGITVIPPVDLIHALTPLVPPDRNGSQLVLRARSGLDVGLSRFRSVFVQLSDGEKRRCEYMGFQIPDKVFHEMFALLNETPLLKHHAMYFTHLGLFIDILLWTVLITMVILMVELGIVLNVDDTQDPSRNITLTVLVTFVVGLVIMIAIRCLQRMKMQKLTSEWTDLMSLCLYQTYKLVIALQCNGPDINLILIKYDTKFCQNYIRDYLLEHINGGQRQDNEELDKIAEKIIEIAMPGYLKSLLANSSPATSVRHATMKNSICLCQHVQLKNLHIQAQVDMQGSAFTKENKLIQQILYGGSFTCFRKP